MSALRFDRCELRPAQRQLLIDGKPATLGGRAFDLLLALVARRDRLVTKNELLDLVWPGLVVEENNLQVQVSVLRKLLGPKAIATIPGRGYRFTLELPGLPDAAAGPAASSAATSQAQMQWSAASAGNLPPAAPLIGRDDMLHELRGAIDLHPLVTLVGAPGIGKTALALSIATALREQFRDGAWWIELAPLSDPGQLPQAVAQALRIALPDPATAKERLASVLRSHELLLVLDNCEHVVAAANSLAAAIVAEAPSVRLLATSQELLGCAGERAFRVEPLSVPAADEPPAADLHGAVALFVQRAQAADPRFALNDNNAAAVADICRRLDGLPLAIELAAARVRLLGVHGMQARLGERFRILTGGTRAALQKHHTLRAAIDWSHALLNAVEQKVLRRLGVFVGGFSLGLAQQVGTDDALDEWAVLDALGTLVDKSLVSVDAGDPVRYRLLETTRAYALERLAEHGETDTMLRCHAHAVRNLFMAPDDEQFREGSNPRSSEEVYKLLRPEIDNLRAALDWAGRDGDEPRLAIELAASGSLLLRALGLTQEVLDRMLPLREAVERIADPLVAGTFWMRLCAAGLNARLPSDVLLDAAERAERLLRESGFRRCHFFGLFYKANALSFAGELDAAEGLLPELVALEREDDPPALRCRKLNFDALLHVLRGRFEEALPVLRAVQRMLDAAGGGEVDQAVQCRINTLAALGGLGRFEEVIELTQRELHTHRDTSLAFLYLARIHALVGVGNDRDAWRTLRQALPVWRRDALVMEGAFNIAATLALHGRYEDAARVDGAAMAHVRRSGSIMHALRQQNHALTERLLAAAHVAPADIARWRQEAETLDEAGVVRICESALG